MKAFFTYVSWLFFGRPVKQKLRTKALQSLGLYVKLVGGVRKGSMIAVLGVMGLASVAIGFFLLIGGLLWLANLNPAAYPWIMVGVGALLTLAGVAGFIFAFREKLWVDLSQVNELTAAALAKFPADDRQTNPAVTALWAMAAEARMREHSRVENELNTPAFGASSVGAAAPLGNLNPTVETPYVGPTTTNTRQAPRYEPSLQS